MFTKKLLVLKKNYLTILFTIFLLSLIIFSKTNIPAAQKGLSLWVQNVIPSLFPFFIATELLNYTNLPYYLGKLTNKFMRPLFNIPGEGSYAFIMGIISGYPTGAKIINKFIIKVRWLKTTLIFDFNEKVISFGFVCIFSVAFPFIREKILSITTDTRPGLLIPILDIRNVDFSKELTLSKKN